MASKPRSRTGKYCVAFGCKSTHKDNLSLHEFPKDNGIRRQWVKFVKVKRKDFVKPTKQSVLCEKHFPPGSYPMEYEIKKSMNIPVKRKVLLPTAVPTIHATITEGEELEMPGRPVLTSTQLHGQALSPPKKLRTAYRKRECTRVLFNHSNVATTSTSANFGQELENKVISEQTLSPERKTVALQFSGRKPFRRSVRIQTKPNTNEKDDLDTSSGCLKTRNSKLLDGDTSADDINWTHSSVHVPSPVVQINLKQETADEENISPFHRENNLSVDEELGKSGDGPLGKISNQCFEVKMEPETLDDGHSTSFRNEKSNMKKGDSGEITAAPEIQENNSIEKAAQNLTAAIPVDGNTKQAFLIDNQPFRIKTELETQVSGCCISENKKAEIQEKTKNSGVSISFDNRKAKSKEKSVQESMMTSLENDYTKSKETFVMANEDFIITINPEFEDDVHDASSSNEKAVSTEKATQKSTFASPVDGHTQQVQCVEPVMFKTELKVPFDVFISSATKKANTKEESAEVMTETSPKNSDTQLNQLLHSLSQPVTIKTEPDTLDKVSAERKDNSRVQTAQTLTETRPGYSYTQLEHCFSQTHHQPFIIKTESETWDDISGCYTEKRKTETNKQNYPQEISVANSVDSNTKIEQVHQIQNQSFIIKSEPVTGDNFLESCVNMEAKCEVKTEQELTSTGPVDGSTRLEQVLKLPSQTFRIKSEPESEDEYNCDASDRIHGEPDIDSVTNDTDISHSELDRDCLINITDDSVINNAVEGLEMKPKPANNRWANSKGGKLSGIDFFSEVPSFVTTSGCVREKPSKIIEDETGGENKNRAEVDLGLLPLYGQEIEIDQVFRKCGGGRSERARKKSAKVLEMEEFEEAARKSLKKEVGKKSITPIQNLLKMNQKSPTSPVFAITSPQSTTKLNISNLTMPTNLVQMQSSPPKNDTRPKSPIPVPVHLVKGKSKALVKLLVSSPTQASGSVIPSTPTSDKPQSKEIDRKATLKVKKDITIIEPKVKEEKESTKELSIPTIPTPNVIHVESMSTADNETKLEIVIVSSRKRKPSKVKLEQEEEEAMINDEYELDVPDISQPDEDSFVKMEDDSLEIPAEEFEVEPKPAKKKTFANMVTEARAEIPSSKTLLKLLTTQYPEKNQKQVQEIIKERGKPKKKRRITAYTLWCKVIRPIVMAEFQLTDFSAISKKLGELWSLLPEKEKMRWKKVAIGLEKREAKMRAEGKAKSQRGVTMKIGKRELEAIAEGKALVLGNTCTEPNLIVEGNAGPKQKRITGYILWSTINRPEVAAEFQPSDFSGISKKLGKLWSQLPEREKMRWKKGALRISKRESKMLAEGKALVPGTKAKLKAEGNARVAANTCTESNSEAEGNSVEESFTDSVLPDQEISYEVVENGTRRCRKKLLDSDGYSYTVQKCYSSTISWNCSIRNKYVRCPAVVRQVGDSFTAANHHIHQPDPDEAERTKDIAKANTSAALDGQWPTEKIEVDFEKDDDSSQPVMPERTAKMLRENNKPRECSVEEAVQENEDVVKPFELERITKRHRENGEPVEPGPEEIQFEIDEEYLDEGFIQKEVVVDSHRHIICASDAQIHLLRNSQTWFVDKTFKFIRRPFVQLWTIHAFIKRGQDIKQRPLVFILMTRTQTEDYIQVLQAIKMLAKFWIQAVVMDFEPAAWTAFRSVFLGIRIHGCFFHWVKCLWRKVMDLELHTPYTECKAVYVFIRKLMALPFLPHQDIYPAFENLQRMIISPQLVILCGYLEETWFKSTVFTLESISVYNMGLRTNNDVEGWQGQIKRKAKACSLGFYPLIKQLRQEANFAAKSAPIADEILYKRHKRRKYHGIQIELDNLWNAYTDRKISTDDFLTKTSDLFGEFG